MKMIDLFSFAPTNLNFFSLCMSSHAQKILLRQDFFLTHPFRFSIMGFLHMTYFFIDSDLFYWHLILILISIFIFLLFIITLLIITLLIILFFILFFIPFSLQAQIMTSFHP